jgi:uncharacterized HAD superfamily protein
MKIGLDIDGTILSIMDVFLKLYNDDNNTFFTLKDINKYDFEHILSINTEEVFKYFDKIDFMKCELVDNTIPTTINYWKSMGHSVDIITACRPDNFEKRCKRLKELGVMFDKAYRVDGSKKDYANKYDLFIDDSPKQLEDILSHGGNPICFSQPWNQEWNGKRIYSFIQIKNVEKWLK